MKPVEYEHSPASKSARGCDEWALNYMHVAHLQPILETIDDDGTEFISIKEINTFTSQTPKGWRYVFDFVQVVSW
jgi:hypothetical protein